MSQSQQLPLKIRGRGNASWTYVKKPYRLKLDKKQTPLGLSKSKHFVLMPQHFDWYCMGRDYFAFEIAKRMGMPWPPGQVPCEVVLNGDYIGLYFLTEKIRIAKERVNIVDQEEDDAEPNDPTGGWLLEIDIYVEDNQIVLEHATGGRRNFLVTYHSPEDLTPLQYDYLNDLLHKTDSAINVTDKSSREWEKYIDLEGIARYYVIQEVVDNQEGFSGSCWFYKDRGDTTKFVFGPVWDFGSSLGPRNWNNTTNFITQPSDPHVSNHWINELVRFPRFQIAVRKQWKHYRDNIYPNMSKFIDDYGVMVKQALAQDVKRWGTRSADTDWYLGVRYKQALRTKFVFLCTQWNEDYEYPKGDVNLDGVVDVTDINMIINIILGGSNDNLHADIDGSGHVDVADVNAAINGLLQK